MTEKELRKICGLKDDELINTNRGALDIFGVKNDYVSYGFLAEGAVLIETVDSFLEKISEKHGSSS